MTKWFPIPEHFLCFSKKHKYQEGKKNIEFLATIKQQNHGLATEQASQYDHF